MGVPFHFDLIEAHVSQQKDVNGAPFPQILVPSMNSIEEQPESVKLDDFLNFVREKKSWIEEQLRRRGAVLFRGCGLRSAEDFNTVVEAFDYEELLYSGLAVRTQVVGRIFTANETPPDKSIPFHHEMAYLPVYPKKVFFFCEVAPTLGGETPVLLSNAVYERMAAEYPDFVRELEKKGWLKMIEMSNTDNTSSFAGRSWQSILDTTDRKEAEQRAAKSDMTMKWLPDGGCLSVLGPRTGVQMHTGRCEKIWFNSILIGYALEEERSDFDSVCFGDGSKMSKEVLDALVRICDEESVAIPYQTGDLFLLDNEAVQHGRNPCWYPRRILASLSM